MKNIMKVILIVGIILIIGGVLGNILFGWNSNNSFFANGMMSNKLNYSFLNIGEKKDIEELKESVIKYIKQYDENLKISDIFIFENTDYYFSIIEKNSGRGAMELLVNPYTSSVYPEYGPNMMWNNKYNAHNGMGFMMHKTNNNGYTIEREEARLLAQVYINDKFSKEYTIPEEGHAFYGYYTFHIVNGSDNIGMLSVNSNTGNIWHHNWHGIVINIIDNHESENDYEGEKGEI